MFNLVEMKWIIFSLSCHYYISYLCDDRVSLSVKQFVLGIISMSDTAYIRSISLVDRFVSVQR